MLGGVLLAHQLLPVLVRWLPEYSFPHQVIISINLPVLAFSCAIARVSAMPEVVAAGISTNATPPANGFDMYFEIFGRPTTQREQLRANFISSA